MENKTQVQYLVSSLILHLLIAAELSPMRNSSFRTAWELQFHVYKKLLICCTQKVANVFGPIKRRILQLIFYSFCSHSFSVDFNKLEFNVHKNLHS